MRSFEFETHGAVDEMALSKYQLLGNFDKRGAFREPDRRLLSNPRVQLKAENFFSKTNHDFRLFFSNIPGTGSYSEYGEVSPAAISVIFKKDAEQILDNIENNITIIYVGNKGVDKVLLTPWMMAHRFGHALRATRSYSGSDTWDAAQTHFWNTINSILNDYYRIRNTETSQLVPLSMRQAYNGLFNVIGTQRSSKNKKINRPYEFMYELFAQYLNTGTITLNPIPERFGFGRQAWGRPGRIATISSEDRSLESRKQVSDTLARDMQLLFKDVLDSAVGKIYLM